MLTPSFVRAYWMRGSMTGIFYAIMQRFGTVGLAPAPNQYGARPRWTILSTYLRDSLFLRLLEASELGFPRTQGARCTA